jgi:hypothetical protein
MESSRLRWMGHVRMDENELPKKILWTHPGGQRRRGRPKSSCFEGAGEDAETWVVETGVQMSRI